MTIETLGAVCCARCKFAAVVPFSH